MTQRNFGEYAMDAKFHAIQIDHVAIGTDMDANFKPVLRSYRD